MRALMHLRLAAPAMTGISLKIVASLSRILVEQIILT
jgi:hypothetical protein